jgi:hypothetical protein
MAYVNDSNEYLPGTIQIPSSINITNITRTYPAVVTVDLDPVTESNTYQAGQLVKLTVPYSYQMFQANNLTAKILEVVGSDMAIDIDARLFDSFVIPSDPKAETPASLAPAGSQNLSFSNDTNNIPFQSLNNRNN